MATTPAEVQPIAKRGAILPPSHGLSLRSFERAHASFVAQWVLDAADLHWLAPGTFGPLNEEKVLAWRKPSTSAFTLFRDEWDGPIGYGELNPMRTNTHHLWIGHVILDPSWRGQGLGTAFVELLLSEAYRQHRAERVTLIVFPDNSAAIRCYLRAGFRRKGMEYHRFRQSDPKHSLLRLEHIPSSN